MATLLTIPNAERCAECGAALLLHTPDDYGTRLDFATRRTIVCCARPFRRYVHSYGDELTPIGRARVERLRAAEPPMSNRRRAKLYAAALREDRARNLWLLQEADARLLSYAIG